MDEEIKILCVDDEKNVLKSLRRLFMDEDYDIFTVDSGKEGLEILAEEENIQIVISDYRMPSMNGVDFLQKVYERWPNTIRIVLSGYADTAAVVSAINEGQIYKFIPKPWNDDELKNNISKALEVYFLHKRNTELTEELTEKNDELVLLNENLEKLVAERTEELIFQNRVLTHSQNILDALPLAVLGFDNNGVIVQCNQKGIEVFKEKGAVIGSTAKEIFPKELQDFIEGISQDTIKSGTLSLAHLEFKTKGSLMKNSDGQEGRILVLDKDA